MLFVQHQHLFEQLLLLLLLSSKHQLLEFLFQQLGELFLLSYLQLFELPLQLVVSLLHLLCLFGLQLDLKRCHLLLLQYFVLQLLDQQLVLSHQQFFVVHQPFLGQCFHLRLQYFLLL